MPKQPSPALAALYERDIALGIDPLEPSPVIALPPQQPPGPPFVIERPDWHEEERERLEREREQARQERDAIVVEELTRIAEDAEQPDTIPAKPRRWRL